MALFRDLLTADKVSFEIQGNHAVYWMPAKIFNQLPIKRWKHNRPPDETRVAEIREWIQTSKRVDGIIYLACVDNEIVCYESNHRREALKGIDGLHNIFVDMMWDATDETVKQEFFRLNKAISVPELFVTETTDIKLDDLLQIVDGFCANYGKLQSPSKHPQRPNFNRDNLMQDIHDIAKETGLGVDDILRRLLQLNHQLGARDKSKLSKTVIEKCERNGLWLFAWKSRLAAADVGL
jgi:hypothetical protein